MSVKNLVSNDVAWALEEINSLYRDGKLKGFTIQAMQQDGEFITGSCGDISFLEKLGMIECAKNDIFLSVNE
ncbi:hypothetical protein [Robertmurraya kyonggiensis]|uniref:Uncharacterized protein n=1 Tax=Robertmurraya kyonggiensis TaxID=1037680 RepID=A0A4U1D3J1_9BACI|nr:hypothetical protein [Robertmurraya kyonggiensis]TKC15686.1 hypothetical protein FA727_16300 [Robertmurraya kyonggiensis]